MSVFYGIITVFILFAICMLLSFALIKIKNSDEKVKEEKETPQIFYITPNKKRKKQTKKKLSIPIDATAIKIEDLKKYLNE